MSPDVSSLHPKARGQLAEFHGEESNMGRLTDLTASGLPAETRASLTGSRPRVPTEPSNRHRTVHGIVMYWQHQRQ